MTQELNKQIHCFKWSSDFTPFDKDKKAKVSSIEYHKTLIVANDAQFIKVSQSFLKTLSYSDSLTKKKSQKIDLANINVTSKKLFHHFEILHLYKEILLKENFLNAMIQRLPKKVC